MNRFTEPHRRPRTRQAALTALLVTATACGLLDPSAPDPEVSGTVTDLPGTPVVGARVELVRTTCSGATACTSRTRGEALTGADGRFRIVVSPDQDEVDLWDLVCHQFFIDVTAEGYVPLEGNYQSWRGGFCATHKAEDILFRLEAAG
jgi:hypothetical protein